MSKKFKVPNLSDKEIEELTQACCMAFGNPAADQLVEQVLEVAEHYQQLRFQFEEQTRTE